MDGCHPLQQQDAAPGVRTGLHYKRLTTGQEAQSIAVALGDVDGDLDALFAMIGQGRVASPVRKLLREYQLYETQVS
jgi:hypothetical protein